MAAAGIKARRVLYSGHVQGVGFRYTSRRIAERFAVTGFVRNLANGRVELVAEGLLADLDRMQAEIAAAMAGYIGDVQVENRPPTGKYNSFDVAF